MIDAIVQRRLLNQRLTGAAHRSPEEVVAWQGAVQAQEYAAARWGLALRMDRRATDKEIARAVDEGRILRTHVMRPTWHFVRAADIRWLLDLTAPRVRRTISHYSRRQGIDPPTVVRALGIFERALGGGRCLTRAELGDCLARAGIVAKGIGLAMLTIHAELDGLICSGPYRGTHLTYALLTERAPASQVLSRDEALAELTRRYFRSHGPATIRDFVWWSGLTAADAKRGLESAGAIQEVVGGLTYSTVERQARAASRRRTLRLAALAQGKTIHMLPVYDEYLVAYRDRAAVPHTWMRPSTKKQVIFQHAVVADGQVAGSWRTAPSKDGVIVEIAALRRLSRSEHQGLSDQVVQYGRFLGQPISLSIDRM